MSEMLSGVQRMSFGYFLSLGVLAMFQLHAITAFGQVVQIIDKTKPSVYLAYNDAVEDKRENATKQQYVVLQLHNNTTVHINVGANFGVDLAPTIENGTFKLPDKSYGTLLKSGSEVELCYDAEGLFVQQGYSIPKKTKNPDIKDLRNSCFYRSNGKTVDAPYSMGYWIRPKDFVRFKVPASLLEENLKVFTEFNYPWEFENGRLIRNEPKHRAYFFYFDVPQTARR